jgi:hypothetical protein
MAFGSRIFEALVTIIKLTDRVAILEQDLKSLAQETHAIDRRVIRLETLTEIARTQPQLIES